MKYLRKIVSLFLSVIFFAALVISIGVIFAVKNINVTIMTYAEEYGESYANAKESLAVFDGESIFFVNADEVSKAVEDTNFSLASFEKILPCTINISLKERLETFAVDIGGELYAMYDDNGVYLRKSYKGNVNVNDESPNVEIIGAAEEEIPEVAAIAATFKQEFKALRSMVSCISVDTKPDIELAKDKLFFNLRCGLVIEIDDFRTFTEEKISEAYAVFSGLSDRQKLGGTLRSYQLGDDGAVCADYAPL